MYIYIYIYIHTYLYICIYEGTVVLCAGLCRGGADGQSAALREALRVIFNLNYINCF